MCYFIKEDIYFAKISTCIENESIAGILTNKLTFADDSQRMLINADDKLFANKDNFKHSSGIEINQKEIIDYYKAKAIDCKNMKLCSDDLRSFRFIGWNLETNVTNAAICTYITYFSILVSRCFQENIKFFGRMFNFSYFRHEWVKNMFRVCFYWEEV